MLANCWQLADKQYNHTLADQRFADFVLKFEIKDYSGDLLIDKQKIIAHLENV